jgi:hypothetical protein
LDIQSSYTGLTLSITATGDCDAGLLTRRSGARNTDLICLSGNVGAAYMGLQLLEREKRVFTGEANKDELPSLEGFEYILERYLKPELPKALLDNLKADDAVPTAMCLLTNGLSDGVLRIAQASGTGANIFLDKIPIARQCYDFAETEENLSPVVAALNGGDDYQMLHPAFVYVRYPGQGIYPGYHRSYMRSFPGVQAHHTGRPFAPPGKPGTYNTLKFLTTGLKLNCRRNLCSFCCLEVGFCFKLSYTGYN